MWEKDRKLIAAFRECFTNLHASMEAGEEVDLQNACVEESQALASYTMSVMDFYKDKNPAEVSDKKQRYFNPKIPYFQNL